MRRPVAALIAAAALLAGCGGGDDAGPAPRAAAATTPEPNAFPVTILHKYGRTTIKAAPKRVAVVGLREQDPLLAVGVVPVAATRFSTDEAAIRPWAEDELGDATPPVVLDSTDGIPIEAVAATRPDLIIGRFSGMTKGEYAQLSRIAPVLAQAKDVVDYGESWQDETRAVGAAVGRRERAEQQVGEGETRIANARRASPELEGRTAVVAAPYKGVFVYGPADARQRLLEELGMRRPAGLAQAVGDRFGGQLSDERLDLIDVDALVWLADDEARATLAKNALYSRLGVAERAIFLPPTDPLYNATSAVTVLNIETILERYVPLLEVAVAKAG